MRLIRVTDRNLDLGRIPEVAAAEGHSFVARMLTEWGSGANCFDDPGEGVFVAIAAGEPIGVCGLNVDPFLLDPSVGRLRHLYVLPAERRNGVGRQLVAACLDLAGQTFRRIRLRTFEPAAAAFYAALGFGEVAERDATHEMWLANR